MDPETNCIVLLISDLWVGWKKVYNETEGKRGLNDGTSV